MTTRARSLEPCPTPFSDHIYKTIHGVDIPLRIWPGEPNKGWLLWFHGGAFIGGKHAVPNSWVVPAFRERGYTVVSAAYRFLPQVDLSEILNDCKDALAWCRANLCSVVAVDLEACVVGGDSAGGTLAVLAGHHFDPPPKVVIDVFGVTDMTDPYFHPREPGARKAERDKFFPESKEFTEDELWAAWNDCDPSHAQVISPWNWEMEPQMSAPNLQTYWGKEYVPGRKDRLRMDMITLVTREKVWFRRLVGDPPDETYTSALEAYSALQLLQGKSTYPPTFFLHGAGDKAVPIDQSYRMAKVLKDMGVAVGEKYHPTGEHCFEMVIGKPDDEGWDEYVVPVLDFVDAHVK